MREEMQPLNRQVAVPGRGRRRCRRRMGRRFRSKRSDLGYEGWRRRLKKASVRLSASFRASGLKP